MLQLPHPMTTKNSFLGGVMSVGLFTEIFKTERFADLQNRHSQWLQLLSLLVLQAGEARHSGLQTLTAVTNLALLSECQPFDGVFSGDKETRMPCAFMAKRWADESWA
ncbi:unnamed protein product [Dibothriocephalus latus]|uniref:Uncharacterized protein n=1 Tax=Dibothriocephalus latus TaxID=60516 RepID=A0A3P7LX11_DIBLA|nr:unnamed protein product [Dibothriocephalus latus]